MKFAPPINGSRGATAVRRAARGGDIFSLFLTSETLDFPVKIQEFKSFFFLYFYVCIYYHAKDTESNSSSGKENYIDTSAVFRIFFTVTLTFE